MSEEQKTIETNIVKVLQVVTTVEIDEKSKAMIRVIGEIQDIPFEGEEMPEPKPLPVTEAIKVLDRASAFLKRQQEEKNRNRIVVPNGQIVVPGGANVA